MAVLYLFGRGLQGGILRIFALMTVITVHFHAYPAQALTFLRDADIEHALDQIAAPVLRAAGLGPGSVEIVLIQSPSLNAFVFDRKHIFIHSGLIERLSDPTMLQSVIAHEAAHIANGHMVQRSLARRDAGGVSALALFLGAVTAAAGEGGAGAALAYGVNSSGRRNFLSHSRAEEAAADKSAMAYLRRAQIDGRGMIGLFDLFTGQETLSEQRQDPYARSHPMSRDRLRAVKAAANTARIDQKQARNSAYWFARARGKLSAYLQNPKWTFTRLKKEPETYRDVAFMREAVAHMRSGKSGAAIAAIDRALAKRPNDPYYLDLKAEIYLRSNRAQEAARIYAAARKAASGNLLVSAGYGRALLASGRPQDALKILDAVRARAPGMLSVLRDMGVAYAQTNQQAMAALLAAERYLLTNQPSDAKRQAKIAIKKLAKGSKAWRRAQDVLDAVES